MLSTSVPLSLDGAEVTALICHFLTSCVCWQLTRKVGKRVILALLTDKVWLNHGISEVPVSCRWLYCVEGMSWL